MNIHGIQSVGTLTQISGGFATLTGSFTGSFKGDGSGLTGITATADTSSLVTTASFNAYTTSVNSQLSSLESATSSYAISSSVKTITDGLQNEINTLVSETSSYALSASVAAVNIAQDGAIATLQSQTSSYAISSSVAAVDIAQDGKIESLTSQTASYAISSSVAAVDIAQDGKIASLTSQTSSYAISSSVAAVDISQDGKIASLTALTASTAYTNVANNFLGTQSFENVNVTGIARVNILYTLYESSSVIYSSGSNQLGDELTDVQTLSGSVKIQGNLTVNGVSVSTQSFVDLDPLNSFTSSQLTINNGYNSFTASTNTSIASLTASVTSLTQSVTSLTESVTSLTASVTSLTASVTANSQSIFANSASIALLSSSFTLVSASALTYATTGSNTFIGTEIITGSLIITGSVSTLPVALSVTSNTASVDFSKGSMFTLTIPSSAITYITASNLLPGQTANIVLTQQATTGSVRFESTLFKFPSGSINTGSAVASAVDMVSVASVNTTTLYSVGAKQLI